MTDKSFSVLFNWFFLHLVRYVGHSMGTTALFVMLHHRPERNAQISRITAMAPVTNIVNVTGVCGLFVPTVLVWFNFQNLILRRHSFISPRWMPLYTMAAMPVLHYTGWNQIQPEQMRDIFYYSPESTSTGTLLHFVNCWLAGRFQSRCGAVEYNLSRVRKPVDVYWAPGDWAAGEKDVHAIAKQLTGSPAVTMNKISSKGFGHLDFLWSEEARPYFPDLIEGAA
jgi:pimeloyl-ACP methyl ester carboxylesterase